MAVPYLKYLSEEELDQIHAATMKVLEETGVVFPTKKALDIFKAAGAKVDYSNMLVKIPRQLVEEAIKHCPSSITLCGRDPKYDVVAEGRKVTFGTIGNAHFVLDFKTGQKRLATNQDLAEITRIIDACDNILHMEPQVTPQDVPKEASYQYSWITALKNTVKHVRITPYGADGVEDALRIGSAIMGSESEFLKRPILSFMVLTVPPLRQDPKVCEGFVEAARYNVPIWFSCGPCSGASSPATLAGTLVIVNVGVLSGITLVQLINPGAPVFYGSFARIMDMKTGQVSLGSPEWGIFRACIGDLARRYRIPSWGGTMIIASKIIDAQAGYEKAITALMSGLGGVNISCGMQLDCENLVSFEDHVVNNEIVGAVLRILRGFEVNEETLAVKVIDQMGPEGVYLKSKHTLKHYKTEFWAPEITERRSYKEWFDDGAKDMWQRAKEKTAQILANHKPQPLRPGAEEELDRIARDAARRLVRASGRSQEPCR